MIVQEGRLRAAFFFAECPDGGAAIANRRYS